MRREARYRCTQCRKSVHLVLDQGPTRRLWCVHCGCTQPFARDVRLTAERWPPPPRQEEKV